MPQVFLYHFCSYLFTFLSLKPYSLYFAAEGGTHILGMAHNLIMKCSLIGNPFLCHWANRSLQRFLGCLNRREQPLAEGCCLPMIRYFQIQWEKEFLLPALLAFSENWFSIKAAKQPSPRDKHLSDVYLVADPAWVNSSRSRAELGRHRLRCLWCRESAAVLRSEGHLDPVTLYYRLKW